MALCSLRLLRVGETASLQCETVFDWRSEPPPHLRRAARTPVERLAMGMAFTPGRPPVDVDWALREG